MLRVREVPTRGSSRDENPVAMSAPSASVAAGSRPAKLAAMAALGLALGAGGAIFTVSLVQAESDDASARAFYQQEAASRRTQRVSQQAAYASVAPTAYAPSRGSWSLPVLNMQSNGRIAHPPIELNPFRPRNGATGAAAKPKAARSHTTAARVDTVSGSADVARTICVRLCDGFHAPIGYLGAKSDMKGHEALCQAMNPGIPVKVFRVAAGADTIDDAQAADGKRYSALPVAYSHEKSADPACRPAIVKAGERRVSLLRDFTLRPGDSVVLDGKVRTFAGGSSWPYSTRDFRDFRSSADLSKGQRQQIDERVGISRLEAEARVLRRQMRLREASLHDDTIASDAITLRGTLDPAWRGPIRVISLARTSESVR